MVEVRRGWLRGLVERVVGLIGTCLFGYNTFREPKIERPKFGGMTIYLTFQTGVLLFIYSLLVLCIPIFASNKLKATRSFVSRPLFAISWFVALGYYGLIHNDPSIVRMMKDTPGLLLDMHLLHGGPPILATLLLVFDSSEPRSKVELIVLSIYSAFYLVWSAFCAYMNGGAWPYPFQKDFNFQMHLIFDCFCFVFCFLLYWIGLKISRLLSHAGFHTQQQQIKTE